MTSSAGSVALLSSVALNDSSKEAIVGFQSVCLFSLFSGVFAGYAHLCFLNLFELFGSH